MTTDVSCLIGARTDELAEEIFAMDVVPKAEWYGPPSDAEVLALDGTVIDGRVMAQVVLCGENAGQFQTLVAEDGVPFTTGYEDLPAPILAGADSSYINDRLENPLAVLLADGSTESIAAGKAGFMHSPGPGEPGADDIETIDDLIQWHDREWATAAMEGVMTRYRLHEVVQDGKTLLVARGSVMPGLTNGAVWAIAQSEVSPEFIPVEQDGEVFLEYVALSHVFHGNTNTTLSAKITAGIPTAAVAAKKFSLVRNVASTIKESGPVMAETLNTKKACGATPCGPCSGIAKVVIDDIVDVDALTAERDALLEANRALMLAEFSGIEIDTTPLKATINLAWELRDALSNELRATYDDGEGSYVWLEDVYADQPRVLFSVEDASDVKMYRQDYSLSDDLLSVSLGGTRQRVAREVEYVDIDED